LRAAAVLRVRNWLLVGSTVLEVAGTTVGNAALDLLFRADRGRSSNSAAWAAFARLVDQLRVLAGSAFPQSVAEFRAAGMDVIFRASVGHAARAATIERRSGSIAFRTLSEGGLRALVGLDRAVSSLDARWAACCLVGLGRFVALAVANLAQVAGMELSLSALSSRLALRAAVGRSSEGRVSAGFAGDGGLNALCVESRIASLEARRAAGLHVGFRVLVGSTSGNIGLVGLDAVFLANFGAPAAFMTARPFRVGFSKEGSAVIRVGTRRRRMKAVTFGRLGNGALAGRQGGEESKEHNSETHLLS